MLYSTLKSGTNYALLSYLGNTVLSILRACYNMLVIHISKFLLTTEYRVTFTLIKWPQNLLLIKINHLEPIILLLSFASSRPFKKWVNKKLIDKLDSRSNQSNRSISRMWYIVVIALLLFIVDYLYSMIFFSFSIFWF